MDDGLDGVPHEHGRIIDDGVIDAFGEVFLQLLHGGADVLGQFEGVGAGHLEDGDGDGGLVVQERFEAVAAGAQFDAGNVLEVGFLTVGTGLDDDVAEFLLGDEAAFDIHLQLKIDGRFDGLFADDAAGDLDVLFAHGGHDVAGREVPGGELGGIEPETHGVIAGAEDLDIAGARNARKDVLDLKGGVIAEVHLVVAAVGRVKVDDHGEVRGLLGGVDAKIADFLGQLGQSLRDAVLNLDLGLVDVGAELEGDGESHHAVARRLREHVKGAFDAVDRLFEGRGNGLGDGLGRGAGVGGLHHDGGRDDLGIFADGQPEHGDEPHHENGDGKHAGENRPFDEKVGEIHTGWLVWVVASG